MCCACLDVADNFVEVNQGYMAHDVFISHAHKDQRIADEICRKLESARVRCWIAERDLSANEDRTVATRTAIEASRLMVLVLSENANAARHLEREIAHAFYTRRIIVPLRLTRTLPNRDFLFYLGNVRWIDAFNLPAEQHLEALTATINGMVDAPAVRREASPAQAALNASSFKTTGTLNFTNWIGALQASHYQTLEILKRVAIGASLFAVFWLVWVVTWQPKEGASRANGTLRSMYPGSGASRGSARQALENASVSNPTYTYTRFGLWVAPSVGSAPSVQQGPQDTSSTTPGTPPAPATASQRPEVGQNTTGEAESLRVHDSASSGPAQEDLTRTVNRRAGHLRKSRHHGRSSSPEMGPFARLKSRIKALLHQIAAGSK
jgi:hypothetical protein